MKKTIISLLISILLLSNLFFVSCNSNAADKNPQKSNETSQATPITSKKETQTDDVRVTVADKTNEEILNKNEPAVEIVQTVGDSETAVISQKVVTELFGRSFSLESDDAYVIADGTDFNTLTEPRTYKVRTWLSGSTMINSPNQNSGRLIVMRTSDWSHILQVYVANTNEHFIYTRLKDASNGWSEWVSMVTSDVVDELSRQIANLTGNSDSFPAYYNDYLTEKVRKINDEMLSLGFGGGDAFVFITDTHEKPTYTAETMQYICDLTNISKIIHGGDSAKDKSTKAEALEVINKYYNHYRLNGCTLYKVVGNHEFNNGGANDEYAYKQLSENELYMTILGDNANHITYDPAGTLAYYFDNPAQKIRYFVLPVNYKATPSWQGVNWILAELENVPTDYDVVVFCHHVIKSTGEYTAYMERLIGGLDAYKAHTTYFNDYTKETHDYTQKTGEVICVCVGDEHMDLSRISEGGIPIIATTCATYNEECGGLDRTLGTVNEGAYDVYVINKNTRTISITRIGAGSDREFTY